MIDVNVFLSRWPFRRLPHDTPERLVEKLESKGVTQAWAGSFDALLHEDIGGINHRLADECARYGKGILVPFGCVNPALPDWEEDLRRCQEDFSMPGIRLHPDYHGYTLDRPEFAQLLAQAEQRTLIVQIAVTMEDERTQHPLVQVPAINVAPLLDLLQGRKSLKVVLLNSQRTVRADVLARLAEAGQVFFDIAWQEGVGGVGKLIEQVPYERVLFGSDFPLFYFESAELKLQESDLGETIRAAIGSGNAVRLRRE